ncbi:DUF3575 domain-containing protein [Spirosoma sp. KCTC 42546]|uniref:DUF3575 domain-containing protein n=1 Tax=Spirosoma sp. KCTC 42546 TaxID=2520506 RepID=UPI00115A84C1|nr:DUF3575 domain-containing protein [Spirosoma sp. KCTC 42546]QDK79447.1 DUF3575 domain-containing protein [Spirosoma sp. KCTC 42546]
MKTYRWLWLFVLLTGQGLATYAQTEKAFPLSSIDAEQSQRWVVKFAALSLIDPSNTIQFGIERMVGQHQAIQAELGYGWQGMNLWDVSQRSRYTDTKIWRGRAEWRYYWHGGPIGSYVALEGLFKQTTANEHGTVGVGCESGPCQYYQMYSAPITKQIWAGHVKFGRQFSLSRNNRLLADFYGGVGVRWGTLDRFTVPEGLPFYGSYGINVINLFSIPDRPTASFSYGIKLGYSF